jgi:hypothetical protein
MDPRYAKLKVPYLVVLLVSVDVMHDFIVAMPSRIESKPAPKICLHNDNMFINVSIATIPASWRHPCELSTTPVKFPVLAVAVNRTERSAEIFLEPEPFPAILASVLHDWGACCLRLAFPRTKSLPFIVRGELFPAILTWLREVFSGCLSAAFGRTEVVSVLVDVVAVSLELFTTERTDNLRHPPFCFSLVQRRTSVRTAGIVSRKSLV